MLGLRAVCAAGGAVGVALVSPVPALASASMLVADGPEGALDLLNDPQIGGSFVTLLLDNGDRLSGTIIDVEGGFVVLEHPVLVEVRVPTTRIVRVELQPAPEGIEPPLPGTVAEPAPQPIETPDGVKEAGEGGPAPSAPAPPPPPPATWKTSIEFGVDGSEGNTERLNFRGGLRVSRDTPGTAMRFNARYVVNTTDGDRSANRFTANIRNDWRLARERWSFFVQGGYEWDEFRDFDSRVTGGAGFAFRFIDDGTTFLSTRLGAGFAREFGGQNDGYNPELIVGLELSHKLTERQTITLTAEYFPDLEDLGEFRSVVRPAWEFRLDTKADLSLRLGFEHRYESQSTRDESSDFDYFATLVLAF